MLLKYPGQAEQGGGVEIVAAGVHHSGVKGSVFQPFRLLYGQSVKVRPEGDAAAVVFAYEFCHNAVFSAQPVFYTCRLKLGAYIIPGLLLVVGEAGMAVYVAAKSYGAFQLF